MQSNKPFKILICTTASVACEKIPDLIDLLSVRFPYCQVELACTTNSLYFVNKWEKPFAGKIHKDEDQWTMWGQKGDPVLHINLANWADLMILAPLDANTLAKIANGVCDNLVTVIARAWDIKSKKPVVFCPSMNTQMFEHPLTFPQMQTLESWGFVQVPPVVKVLACGVKGIGAMADVSTVADEVCKQLS